MSVRSDRHDTRRLGRGGGFSLVELMSVVAIAAIVAATAAVKMSSTKSDRSASATRLLLHDVAFARQRAVATGYRSWIDFSTANQWRLLAEDSTHLGRTNAQVLTDPASGGNFTQAVNTGSFLGVTLTSVNVDGENWIGFDWVGEPLKKTAETTPLAADAVFTFSSGQKVTVNKDTGHATYTP